MALQLERSTGRRVTIQGLPVNNDPLLLYKDSDAAILLPPNACSTCFPHWLAWLFSVQKGAPSFSSHCLQLCSFQPTGIPFLAGAREERVERVPCSLENVLVETLIEA